jgi:hypothetical protein
MGIMNGYNEKVFTKYSGGIYMYKSVRIFTKGRRIYTR